MATMKVKAWGEGQGEFVEIDADDFNADFHQPYEETGQIKARKKKGAAETPAGAKAEQEAEKEPPVLFGGKRKAAAPPG